MSRIERLVNLTAALLAAEAPLTADQLRERVPGYPSDVASFRRQFERDKDALRELGLPLRTVSLRADSQALLRSDQAQAGYLIEPDDYFLKDPGLEPDELAAMQLATRLVRLEGLDGSSALWKLGGTGDSTPGVDAAAAVLPGADALSALFSAIAQHRCVELDYRGTRRTIEPRQLAFRNGHWYLLGFDRTRNEDRSYRVDRIESGVDLGGRIAPNNAGLDASAPSDAQSPGSVRSSADFVKELARPWELGDGDATPVWVAIDAPQASWALTHLGAAPIETASEDSGRTVVRLDVRNFDALRSFVLGFLDHAEIVAPPAARAEMIRWLEALARPRSEAVEASG